MEEAERICHRHARTCGAAVLFYASGWAARLTLQSVTRSSTQVGGRGNHGPTDRHLKCCCRQLVPREH